MQNLILKIPISTRHCIILIGMIASKSPYEWINHTIVIQNNPIIQTNKTWKTRYTRRYIKAFFNKFEVFVIIHCHINITSHKNLLYNFFSFPNLQILIFITMFTMPKSTNFRRVFRTQHLTIHYFFIHFSIAPS